MKTKQQKIAYAFGIIAGIAVGFMGANVISSNSIFVIMGTIFIVISSLTVNLFNWTKE